MTTMGQAEVYEILEREKKWLSANEIAERMPVNAVSPNNIRNCLRRLANAKFVEVAKGKEGYHPCKRYRAV